jgi:hypothetical protein
MDSAEARRLIENRSRLLLRLLHVGVSRLFVPQSIGLGTDRVTRWRPLIRPYQHFLRCNMHIKNVLRLVCASLCVPDVCCPSGRESLADDHTPRFGLCPYTANV